jgi:retron-type reverse transcriptase
MNHELLKQIKEVIIAPFTKLMNYCIRTDIFPNCLKRSIVIPIFKKGDRNDCKNYRPISLLPVFSKIFEKLLLLQIVIFFNKNNLFSNAQFGFRKGLSTSSAVLSFIDNIVRSFEKNNHYKVIFLDLSKAFDTVSHDILIKKLGYYKFSSSSISMITSYLSNRTQKVKVNGVFFRKI